MKKRIGSRIYDTDTAEKIAAVFGGDLYRKRTRGREFFLLSQSETGPVILPLKKKEAEALLGKNVKIEEPEPENTVIRVDQETYKLVMKAARKKETTMSQIVKELAKAMLK